MDSQFQVRPLAPQRSCSPHHQTRPPSEAEIGAICSCLGNLEMLALFPQPPGSALFDLAANAGAMYRTLLRGLQGNLTASVSRLRRGAVFETSLVM